MDMKPIGKSIKCFQRDAPIYRFHSAKIVIYDLQAHVRFTVTQPWDRSADALSVSHSVALMEMKILTLFTVF